MKKVYLLVSGLFLVAGASTAQNTGVEFTVASQCSPQTHHRVASRPGLTDERAADDIIWENDFADPADWIAAGPAATEDNGWTIGTTTTGWYFGTDDDMGTDGNFARFANGDPNTGDPAVIEDGPFTLTYNGTIDLSGIPAPHFEFEQYGARFITLQSILVSTDGGTSWTEVGNNNSIDPLTGGGGAVYGQPEVARYNMTASIAADPSNVMIRFSWDGAMNGASMNYIEYGWFVDNVRIVEGHAFDSDIQSAYFKSGVGVSFEYGLTYYQVPQSQVTEIEFSAETINQGGSTFTNLHLNADVTGAGTYSGTSDNIDLGASEMDSLGATVAFTPVALGEYNITWNFTGDGVDTYADNDEIAATMKVTDYTYARDNNVSTGNITNFASNSGESFAIGNGMDIFADGVIGALDIKIGDATDNVDQLIFGQIMRFDEGAGDFVYIDQTNDHTITSGENGGWIRVVFDDPISVSAGDLILVLAGHYGGVDVQFGMAQDVEEGVWGYDAGSTRFGLTDASAIMIRADFRDFTSVEENASNNFAVGQNMPNPFGDNSVINYELNEAANVAVQFVDISGKIVKTINNGTQAAGTYTLDVNAADFAEGVYFYTFTIGAEKVTKRMVITK